MEPEQRHEHLWNPIQDLGAPRRREKVGKVWPGRSAATLIYEWPQSEKRGGFFFFLLFSRGNRSESAKCLDFAMSTSEIICRPLNASSSSSSSYVGKELRAGGNVLESLNLD